MTHKKAEFEKNLAKRMKKVSEEKFKEKLEIAKLTGKEKLDYEIKNLKSEIKNIKYDLRKFPDNSSIQNKLNNSEELLAKKESELREWIEKNI